MMKNKIAHNVNERILSGEVGVEELFEGVPKDFLGIVTEAAVHENFSIEELQEILGIDLEKGLIEAGCFERYVT